MKTTPFLCAFLFGLILLCSAAANKSHVTIINSYHSEFNWVRMHNGALKRGLAGRADVSTHYLDYKRTTPEQSALNVKKVKAACEKELPDVAVLTDDFALKSFGQYFVDKGIPVVFLGVNGNVRDYVTKVSKVTGILERPLVKRSVVFLREILGQRLNRCLVIMDHSMSSRSFIRESLQDKRSFKICNVTVDVEVVKNFKEWQQLVLASAERGYDAIIAGIYFSLYDEKGEYVEGDNVMRWSAKESPLPFFALWDISIGKNRAVGGYVLSGVDQGEQALSMVRRILDGENIENIKPIIGKKGTLIFSLYELRRWNINLPREMTRDRGAVRLVR